MSERFSESDPKPSFDPETIDLQKPLRELLIELGVGSQQEFKAVVEACVMLLFGKIPAAKREAALDSFCSNISNMWDWKMELVQGINRGRLNIVLTELAEKGREALLSEARSSASKGQSADDPTVSGVMSGMLEQLRMSSLKADKASAEQAPSGHLIKSREPKESSKALSESVTLAHVFQRFGVTREFLEAAGVSASDVDLLFAIQSLSLAALRDKEAPQGYALLCQKFPQWRLP